MGEILGFLERDDLENFEKLVSEGQDLAYQQEGKTYLHLAASHNAINVVKYLLSKGVDVNAQENEKKETPLFYSIKELNSDVTKELLKAGAKVDIENSEGETALFLVIKANQCEFIDEFVKKGADVNCKNKAGQTPLMVALENPDKRVIQQLINANANLEDAGISSEQIEQILRQLEISEACPRFRRNYEDYDELFEFCINNNADSLEKNMANIDPSLPFFDGETLLHCAVENNSLECVNLLIRAGADVNAKTTTFLETPLHIAIQNDNPDICDLLIEAGADIEQVNADNESALFIAIRAGDIAFVRALINNKSNINEMNSGGITPLQLAIILHQTQIAIFLIEEGASASLGMLNSYAIALENGELDVCEAIRVNDPTLARQAIKSQCKNRSDPPSELFTLIRTKNTSALKRLLTSQYDLNVSPQEGIPLVRAIESGSLDIVKMIINAGSDIDVDAGGELPLSLACRLGHLEIVKYLLSQGADPRRINSDGESLLFSALRSNNIKVLQEVLRQDPIINTTNANGISPLYLAVGLRNTDAVKLLINAGADPNLNGHSPFKLAQELKLTSVVNLLQESGATTYIKRSARITRQQNLLLSKTGTSRAQTPISVAHGKCCKCGSNKDLMKLIPCGHSITCKDCCKDFVQMYSECPVCHLNFFATSKFN